jgi:hypothetical protein
MNDIKDTKIDRCGCLVNIYIEKQYGLERVFYPHDEFTLAELYKALKTEETMIYVFCDRGTSGEIYRCGNYGEGIWEKYADTKGYV